MGTSASTWQTANLQARIADLAVNAIAVYGIGVAAKNLLVECQDQPIVGLMDKDPANLGRHFYGKPVISDSEALAAGVDVIVVAASDIYWQTIARRITPFCEEHGIRILFPDGSSPEQPPPSSLKPPERDVLETLIADHDIVSFDLFDTLALRSAARPDDILEAAIASIENNGTLLGLRKEAEVRCTQQFGRYAYALARIYEVMQNELAVPSEIAVAMQKAEIEAEIGLTVARPEIVEILNRCRQSGKTVAIVSDTHLPRPAIEAILARCGISDISHVLISCEAGCAKASGLLFALLKSAFPNQPILHIGDNAHSDERQAREQGLAVFRTPAPGELFGASRLAPLLSEVRTTEDGLLLGQVMRRLFADPFESLSADGRARITSLNQFAYCFFGPLILAWLGWLIRRLQVQPADHLLFFAREGYLLAPLYNALRSSLSLTNKLPAGTYFATSRRMACVAALRTPDDVLALLADDYAGTSEGLLRLRFGLANSDAATDDHITNADERATRLVQKMMPAILANAADERSDYLAYIRRLGIMRDSRIAVADLGIKGTIQHALQRMLGQQLTGYYMTGRFGAANPFGMTHNTEVLLPALSEGKTCHVHRLHILCESVLVAPEGMHIRALANGKMAYAPRQMNQIHFCHKAELHAGIRDFIDDWQQTGLRLPDARFSLPLIDGLFAQTANDALWLSDELKTSFYVDERFRAETEKKIWD